MRPGARFSQVLDEQLARMAASWAAPVVAPAAPRPAPSTPNPFVLCSAGPSFAGPARSASSAYTAGASFHPRPAAPPRALSASQARALDCLRSLGVGALDPSFTEAELKSAFRAIARSYHPDRHLHATERERQQLSRTFAGACDAYRELSRIFVH